MPLHRAMLYLHTFNVLDGGNTSWLNTSDDVQRITEDGLDELIADL